MANSWYERWDADFERAESRRDISALCGLAADAAALVGQAKGADKPRLALRLLLARYLIEMGGAHVE